MTKLETALAYAARGWAVFPLRGKVPAIGKADGGRGCLDGTTDTDKIKDWWTKNPDANIGIATGDTSGFWVLDIDGDDGEESLAALVAEHDPLPDTVEQLTGKGRHLLFKFNGEAVQNSVRFRPGLDTRATGGYIVAAPSYHKEKEKFYAWEVDHHPDDMEPTTAPNWLVKAVGQHRDTPRGDAPPDAPDGIDEFLSRYLDTGKPKGPAYGKAALAGEVEAVRAAPIGEQENTLNAAALKIGGHVAAGLLDHDDARAQLIDAGMCMVNDPGKKAWTLAEVTTKVDHGLRDGMAAAPQHQDTPIPDAPPAKTASHIKLIHWSDLQDLPKREPLIKGVLDCGAMSVIYGAPGCGKTFLALDMALRISLGWDWFGHKTKQGAVVYIAAEGGLGSAERLLAFQDRHEIEPDGPFYLLPLAIDLCRSRTDAAEVARQIKQMDQPVIEIVIDTVSRTLAGGNENDSADLGNFVANCDFLRRVTAAHVGLVHHTGKDEKRGSRGHSLLAGAADTMIEVVRSDFTGISTATVRKQRDIAAGAAFTFKLDPVEIGMDEDEEWVTSCVVEPTDAPAHETRAKLSDAQKVALDQLRRAISQEGQIPPPNSNIPTNTPAVTIKTFRTYCMSGGMSVSEKYDAQQKAFKRVTDKLLAVGLIAIWQQYVWLTGKTDKRT